VKNISTPLLLGLVLSATLAAAQTRIPDGTIIPVELKSTIAANNAKPGERIIARVAQDVPLGNGEKIKAGSKVLGEVLTSTSANGSQRATITLRFDKLESSGQVTPVLTDLRALASPLEVEAAQTDIASPDENKQPWSMTTNLIGGNDVAYRGAGEVDDGVKKVGRSTWGGSDWGVLEQAAAVPEEPCRGEVAGNSSPQAMWVFSHDACGVFGYHARIAHAGRTKPEGAIALNSQMNGNLKLREGSALLLRVEASGTIAQQRLANQIEYSAK
jgi:hypothetical protein